MSVTPVTVMPVTPTIVRSDFDSQIFGMEIGWATSTPTGDFESYGYDVVFLRTPLPCRPHPRVALIDVRLDMVRNCAGPTANTNPTVRVANDPADFSFAAILAERAFLHVSRYAADPILRPRAGEVYRRWALNAYARGDLYVFDDRGFMTISQTDDALRVDLIAVAEEHRGRGVGQDMLRAFLCLPGPQARRIRVEAANVPALKSYKTAGFAVERAEVVQHLHRRPTI